MSWPYSTEPRWVAERPLTEECAKRSRCAARAATIPKWADGNNVRRSSPIILHSADIARNVGSRKRRYANACCVNFIFLEMSLCARFVPQC